jgi:integrase
VTSRARESNGGDDFHVLWAARRALRLLDPHSGNLCRREFQPLLERAGLTDEGFTIHSLRHTFATTLADKGVCPSTAQKMLGHSDIRMTLAIYTHPTEGMQDFATAALEETFSRSGC